MAPPPVTPSNQDNIDDSLTILVTGFGPFQQKYPVNPSYEIAKSLPQLLPRSAVDCHSVSVTAYGSPIRVCYDDARELIPHVLEGYAKTIDLVLHIGMASGRRHYTIERYGHRDNYGTNRDLDGKVLSLDAGERSFGDCPSRMTTSLDYEDVLRRWQEAIAHVPAGSAAYGADCRPSDDAGHYLCDYTYFNSLAWFGRRNKRMEGGAYKDRPVLFLHVPAESDPDMLEKGRAVTTVLLQAMVDSYVMAKSNGAL